MKINIDEWLNLAIEKLQKVFREKLLFVGLQGSYNRGEATPESDIDLVVILDKLSLSYKKYLSQTISNCL